MCEYQLFSVKKSKYKAFSLIDGDHPLKNSIKNIYVGYNALHRTDGEVAYFNFELAIEMGLLPKDHPHQLNSQLKKDILHTFSLKIVNEYDILNNTKIDRQQMADKQYMATRYLQLQHPNKFGKTSGDGRSIWNGHFKGENGHWDISSCGTGATRLSPACVTEKKFFRTGTNLVSYGCGLASFREGVISAIYSDLMHKNGVPTERILAIIRFGNGTAINVRAAKNLLRPAHFFGYVRRKDYSALKNLVEYCIDREVENKNFPKIKSQTKRYNEFLKYITKSFAQTTAIYESEYIFCWMDWDGDNVLFNGGIIDYGTIRQFGLFHHEYRFDDVDKLSTNLTEQKNKAKYTVQVFAQIIDYLLTKKHKHISEFKHHQVVDFFNEMFVETRLKRLIWKLGYTSTQVDQLLNDETTRPLCEKLQEKFRFFEKAVSKRSAYKVADGVTRDAIFCMRDFLREFPRFYRENKRIMNEGEFIQLVSSDYASRLDKSEFRKKSRQIKSLQNCYIKLIRSVSNKMKSNEESVIDCLVERSLSINRYEKLTGNAIIGVVDRMLKLRNQLSVEEMQRLIRTLVDEQLIDPEHNSTIVKEGAKGVKSVVSRRLLKWSRRTMHVNRNSI